MWASYGVLCRHWRVGALDATLAIALGCFASAVPLYALGVVAGVVPSKLIGAGAAPWAEMAWQAVFQGGVSMWLAGLAYTQVVSTFGPVRATMLTSLVPPLVAIGALMFLGESLSVAAIGGLVCVTIGLLVGLRAPSVSAAPPTATATAIALPRPS